MCLVALPNVEHRLPRSGRIGGRTLAIIILAMLGLVFILAMISDFEGIADVLSALEG
jgi:hypothetical protein